MLPEVRDSSAIYGVTDPGLLGGAITLGGMAGDQQAALFGQGCRQAGMAKNTYGTGCFLLMHTGTERKHSSNGLLSTVAWQLNGKLEYALEGSVFMTGGAVKWLRDSLGLIRSASETEHIAREAGGNGGVYVVPAFAGLGAPYWDMDARGIICGLTQGVTSAHIVRATLESIAYQSRDVLDAMRQDSGIALRRLKVDGGASANNFLMQFQADVLGTSVVRPHHVETTALGAALLAAYATGFRKPDDEGAGGAGEQIFEARMGAKERDACYAGWLEAVARARH
jgi:glycerol kinase